MTIELQDSAHALNNAPSLQEAIDQAGSAVNVLWQPNAPHWRGAGLPDEFVGWAKEQSANYTSVALSDLSFHMRDLFIDGPDATRLLADCSVNDYDKFTVGQAKQFVAVNEQGQLVADAILLRTAQDKYTLSGAPSAMSWVLFHAEQGKYDVSFIDVPDVSNLPAGQSPALFRYQVQGPRALDLITRVFGGPLPEIKFFHAPEVTLDGRTFRALRHGMAAQPGFEFIGQWADHDFVKQALLSAGEAFGLVQVGALAYSTLAVASGWLAAPTAAIYSDPKLKPYREWLSSYSFEAHNPLHGTYFSPNIEDYYVSPFEAGYGKSISFKRDFPGRDALVEAKSSTTRTKVTLVLNSDDVRDVFGDDIGFYCEFTHDRIEADGALVGMTHVGTHADIIGKILYLSLVDNAYAAAGTEVTLVLGEDPGTTRDAGTSPAFTRVRATVQPAPYDDFARGGYRRD